MATITLDLRDFETRLAVLKRPQAPLVRALNRSIASGKTAVVRAITEDTGLKKGDVGKYVTVSQATASRLTASVSASPKRLPLILFNARGPEPSRGKGRGVTARLKGGAGRYPHAFITTVGGQHRGVFQRTGRARLPIRQLYGPSIWQAFKKHAPAATVRAHEQLGKNIEHEITFAMSR